MVREIDAATDVKGETSAGVSVPLYHLVQSLAGSDFELRQYNIEELNGIEEMFEGLSAHVEYIPDYLLPLPTEISVDDAKLLTPFPAIVEAPSLNVEFSFSETLNKVVDGSLALSDGVHKVT